MKKKKKILERNRFTKKKESEMTELDRLIAEQTKDMESRGFIKKQVTFGNGKKYFYGK